MRTRKDLRFLKSRFLRKARYLIKRKYAVKRIIAGNSCVNNEMEADTTCMKMMSSTIITPNDRDANLFQLCQFSDSSSPQCSKLNLMESPEQTIDSVKPNDYNGNEKEAITSSNEMSIQSLESIDEANVDGTSSWAWSSMEAQPNAYRETIEASDADNHYRSDKRIRENKRNTHELTEYLNSNTGQRHCQVMENSNHYCSVVKVPKSPGVAATITDERLCRNPNHGVFKAFLEDSGASSDSGYRVEMDEYSKWQTSRQMMQGTDRRRTETEPSEVSSIALARRLTVERYLPANRLLTSSGMISCNILISPFVAATRVTRICSIMLSNS